MLFTLVNPSGTSLVKLFIVVFIAKHRHFKALVGTTISMHDIRRFSLKLFFQVLKENLYNIQNISGSPGFEDSSQDNSPFLK